MNPHRRGHQYVDLRGFDFLHGPDVQINQFGQLLLCNALGSVETNNWRARFLRMLDMANDSNLFHTEGQLSSEGWTLSGNVFLRGGERMLPLYEGKMIWHFDHRFGTYQGQTQAQANKGFLPQLTTDQHANPICLPKSEYWVAEKEVEPRLAEKWQHGWLLGWRDITGVEKARTVVVSLFPRVAVGHTTPLILPDTEAREVAALYANLSAFVFDYCARQKIGGTHLTYGYLHQLPVLAPTTYAQLPAWSGGAQTIQDWVLPRVLELTYTAWDLEAFAQDCGRSGPPFRWDEERRFQLRSELDAAFFHLYGLNRDDTAYILDTFPIVKRKDEEKFGTYRTKDAILEIYDALAESQRTKNAFQTQLAPIAASFRITHPPRLPALKRVALDSADKFLLSFIYAFLKQTHQEATFGLVDSVFHLLRQRANHASEFVAAVGDAANAWLSGFNDKPSNDAFLPFLKRLERDGWITADRMSGCLTMTDNFPAVPFDAWRNYDVSAALRVIAERPDIAELVVAQPNTALAAHEFRALKTA